MDDIYKNQILEKILLYNILFINNISKIVYTGVIYYEYIHYILNVCFYNIKRTYHLI